MSRIWFIVGLLTVVLAMPAPGQEYRSGDIVIRMLPDLPQSTTHGYHEFPFQVINESSSASRRVTLEGPASIQTGIGMHSLRVIERTVTVGPRSSVHMALLQPPIPVFGSGLRVRIDGRAQSEAIPWSSGHPEYWVSTGRRAGARTAHRSRRVLISQRLTEQGFPPHKPEDYWVFRAVIPIDAWSDDWLAYSGYDGVVITAADLADASAAVVEALRQYVETGGSLLLLGRPGPELLVRSQASRPEAGLQVDYLGFGVVLTAAEATQVLDFTAPQVERLEQAWRHSRKIWDRARDPAAAHRQFAVADSVEIPVRGLFLMVLAFTVLIGPINLWLLTRRGKRMWLLWTVPAASVLTCALVVLYVFLGEGWVRYGRTEGLTVLDQVNRRATTVGMTGFYATVTPGDGLRFDVGTEVTPVMSWARGQQTSSARSLEWNDRQHLGTGWLRARLPAYFMVRKTELRRERISLRHGAEGAPEGEPRQDLVAVNGLGVDLGRLFLADADGHLYQVEDVAAGATAILEPTGELAAAGPGVLREIYRGDLASRLLRMEKDPDQYLRAGTWIAIARASPFIETGLEDLDRATEKAVIYGFHQEDVDGGGGR